MFSEHFQDQSERHPGYNRSGLLPEPASRHQYNPGLFLYGAIGFPDSAHAEIIPMERTVFPDPPRKAEIINLGYSILQPLLRKTGFFLETGFCLLKASFTEAQK